jgi:hypothetical protein
MLRCSPMFRRPRRRWSDTGSPRAWGAATGPPDVPIRDAGASRHQRCGRIGRLPGQWTLLYPKRCSCRPERPIGPRPVRDLRPADVRLHGVETKDDAGVSLDDHEVVLRDLLERQGDTEVVASPGRRSITAARGNPYRRSAGRSGDGNRRAVFDAAPLISGRARTAGSGRSSTGHSPTPPTRSPSPCATRPATSKPPASASSRSTSPRYTNCSRCAPSPRRCVSRSVAQRRRRRPETRWPSAMRRARSRASHAISLEWT